MKLEIWTRERSQPNGYPKTLYEYDSNIIPETGSWIALGKGEGGAFPTWRVIKVIHIPALEKVKIEVSGS